MMKYLSTTLLFLIVNCAVFAQNFQVGNHLYSIISKEDKTVSIEKFTSEEQDVNDMIPATVTNDGITFTVTSIGGKAYSYSRIKEITIPHTIKSIKDDAFYNCFYLKKVNITDLAAWLEIDFESPSANPIASSHNLYLNGKELKELIVPEGVKKINNGTFLLCQSLRSVKLSQTVEYIGVQAFKGCFYINKIDLGAVQYIDEAAFEGCNGIKSINIPKTVNYLGLDTFAWTDFSTITVDNENPYFDSRDNCNGIIRTSDNTLYLGCRNTEIPNSVDSIGNHAFKGNESIEHLVIPNNVKFIGINAIDYCINLRTLTMPPLKAFRYLGCIGIEDLNITCNNYEEFIDFISTYIPYYGVGPTSISTWHFYIDGEILTHVVLPDSITEIYQLDFYNCPEIRKVTCYAVHPPKMLFTSYGDINIKLYVPAEAIDDYKHAEPWSEFNNILPITTSGINNAMREPATSESTYYDLSGRKSNGSANGIFIKNRKKYIK